jgi:uncharacterized membrane protein SirB2
MSYLLLKHLHITCVILSGLGFALRGWWMLRESSMLHHRVARIAPHVIDSTLLGSAIMMVVMSAQYPFYQPWLTAKLFGLFAYILLGMMALKRAKTKATRTRFFILALLSYAYIASVALTRNPLIVL